MIASKRMVEMDFAARLGLVLTVLSSGLQGCAPAPTAELPGEVTAGSMLCDADSLLLFGLHHSLGGVPGESEAVVVQVERGQGDPVMANLGSGLVADESLAGDGVLYVLVLPFLGEGNGRVYRSRDRASVWESVENTPPDIIGLAFESASGGYVWSADRVHRTDDGGNTWTDVELPVEASRYDARAVVSSRGILWLPTGRELGNAAVLRVSPDLRTSIWPIDSDGFVKQVELSRGSDDPWILFTMNRPRRGALLRLHQVGAGEIEATQVASFPRGNPNEMHVCGETISILLTRESMIGNRPWSYRFVSRDLGRTWHRASLPKWLVREACFLDDGGAWILAGGSVYEVEG